MPTYHFRNLDTGEVSEVFCSITEKEEYLKNNPNQTQILFPLKIVSDRMTNIHVTDSFREAMSRVKENHPKNRIKDY